MLETVDFSGPLALTSWRNVTIQSWYGAPTVPALEAALAATQQLAARCGETKIASLSVVSVVLTLPDDEVRRLSTEMITKLSGAQIAAATVVAGGGFRASAARAAVAGMFMISRSTTPRQVFGTVEDAATWLGRRIRVSPGEVRELTESTRLLVQRQLERNQGSRPG